MIAPSTSAARRWLFETLSADGPLADLVSGIHDEKAPEGASFDYVVLGNTADAEGRVAFSVSGSNGGEDIRIHTRPAERELPGSAKARAIYDEVKRILHGADAVLEDGSRLCRGRVELIATFVEPDGLTTTGPVRFTYDLRIATE